MKTDLKGKHHRKGVKVTEETRKKQSEAKKGERHPKFTGYYITPFGTFASSRAAADEGRKLGMRINNKTIIRLCKSDLYSGYSFKKV